jgi:Domain of unknown function (DUF4157)
MRLAPSQQQSRRSHRRDGPSPARKVIGGRPYGLNHVAVGPVTDTLESRAEEAASRVARGEVGVGRTLGTAPTASVLVPSSGAPLGEPERLRLERGFGADLRAVCVHHDEPSAAAARAEGAQAFTAGRDIYFNHDHYDPGSAEGFRLLAHEVAHVLQQTARSESDCYLRATNASGSGAVQRAADGGERAAP